MVSKADIQAQRERVLQNYREALRLKYGNAVADKSNLYYKGGWYYIVVARKCPDGSYYTDSIADRRRKKQVTEMTNNLLEVNKKEGDNGK